MMQLRIGVFCEKKNLIKQGNNWIYPYTASYSKDSKANKADKANKANMASMANKANKATITN